ncbi:hypothetical protein J8273_8149 [Carpediemonas membranifera]|uniref:Uncharacterized protein n=1 Tax=Carpediemonas membranifera TaxID=201153 RepID=A0A8J6BU94_9EUKA|nr:hypothetical protein J8273_8149 [Carpediemonas membranifera]|eukprot:KAG9390111.1 hypothetical protein J8273_8149 [Carpediemonas membranifera]
MHSAAPLTHEEFYELVVMLNGMRGQMRIVAFSYWAFLTGKTADEVKAEGQLEIDPTKVPIATQRKFYEKLKKMQEGLARVQQINIEKDSLELEIAHKQTHKRNND